MCDCVYNSCRMASIRPSAAFRTINKVTLRLGMCEGGRERASEIKLA